VAGRQWLLISQQKSKNFRPITRRGARTAVRAASVCPAVGEQHRTVDLADTIVRPDDIVTMPFRSGDAEDALAPFVDDHSVEQ